MARLQAVLSLFFGKKIDISWQNARKLALKWIDIQGRAKKATRAKNNVLGSTNSCLWPNNFLIEFLESPYQLTSKSIFYFCTQLGYACF